MITIGYSTRRSNPEFQEYLKKSSGHPKVQIIEKVNNGEKNLSTVYNEIITESLHDIVVLCHDDIYFDTKNWANKLIKNFDKNDFDIIGVAGTSNIPNSGRWWEDMNKMCGIVNHENEGKKWESKYSNNSLNTIQQVCLIDGVFISFNKKKIKNKFNESVNGFHFYDVYFSVENHLSGCKIGVTHDVRLTHKSIGMTNDKWEENRLKFIEDYSESLPINMTPNIDYTLIDKVEKNEKYQVILQSYNTEQTKKFIESVKNICKNNIELIVISNGQNTNELKEISDITVFEGYFDSISKNMSVLKWDEEFSQRIKDLIFFSTDNTEIKNDVFYHLNKIAKKEKNNFGCIFPTMLNEDNSIFSSGLILFNDNDKMGLFLNGQNKFYEIFQGHKKNYFGSVSNLFLTTKNNLNKLDWFNLHLDTEISFTDFSFKLSNTGLNVLVDTNSIIKITSPLNIEKFNTEISTAISSNIQNDNFKNSIKQIKK